MTVLGVLGVDVSYHNGPIDWTAVAWGGYPWATAKVSSGTRAQSPSTLPWAAANVPGMLRSGLGLVGGYHYLRPGNIAEQVGFYLGQMQSLLGGVAGRICQLDVEDDGNGAPSWGDVLAWCQEFARRTDGHPLALYLPDWYWERLGKPNLAVLPNVVLWRSEYVSGSGASGQQLLNGVQSWMWGGYGGLATRILQYSSKATVPGVPTRCDVNVFPGTLGELTRLLTGTTGNDQEDDMDGSTPITSPADAAIPGVNGPLTKSFAWWIAAQYAHILGAENAAKTAAAGAPKIAALEAQVAGLRQVVEALGATLTVPVQVDVDLDTLAGKVAELVVTEVGPDAIVQRIADRLGNG